MSDDLEKKNIVIFGGAGASGSALAWKLAEAGNDVTIIDADREAITQIATNPGITMTVKGEDGMKTVPFAADKLRLPENLDGIEQPDLVIVAVKAFDLDAKLGAVVKQVAGDAPVVELSNGVKGMKETDFTAAVGDNLVQGVLEFPSKKVGKAETMLLVPQERVAQAGIAVGNDSGVDLDNAQEIFEAAGVKIKVEQPTKDVILKKLSSIASMGAMAALGATFKDAAAAGNDINESNALISDITRAATLEVYDILTKAGVDLGEKDEYLETQLEIMRKKGESPGSMAMDVKNGKQTERNAIYGGLLELAQEGGVAAPTLAKIAEVMQVVEDQGIYDERKGQEGMPLLTQKIKAYVAEAKSGQEEGRQSDVKAFQDANFSKLSVQIGAPKREAAEAARG